MGLSRTVSEIYGDFSQKSKVVPFDRLYLVSYSNFVRKMHRFWNIRLVTIQWPWNQGYGSLKVIEPTRIDSPPVISY